MSSVQDKHENWIVENMEFLLENLDFLYFSQKNIDSFSRSQIGKDLVKKYLENLYQKGKYNELLSTYEGLKVLFSHGKYEFMINTKEGMDHLLSGSNLRCLLTFEQGKQCLLNQRRTGYNEELYKFQEGRLFLINNDLYEPFLRKKSKGLKFMLDNGFHKQLLKLKKGLRYLLGCGKYTLLAENQEGRQLLIENDKSEFVLSTQEGRDQFLKSIKNNLKISQKTYMLLCISCIKYGDAKSFEILKNTKMMHPSKDIINLLENHNVQDEIKDFFLTLKSTILIKHHP